MYSILFLAISSLFFSLLLTPLIRRGFRFLAILDQPYDFRRTDGAMSQGRKPHCTPIPRVGGVSIAAAYLIAFALLLLLPACGSTPAQAPVSGTPPGNYTITVTATSGSDTKSQTITLSVP